MSAQRKGERSCCLCCLPRKSERNCPAILESSAFCAQASLSMLSRGWAPGRWGKHLLEQTDLVSALAAQPGLRGSNPSEPQSPQLSKWGWVFHKVKLRKNVCQTPGLRLGTLEHVSYLSDQSPFLDTQFVLHKYLGYTPSPKGDRNGALATLPLPRVQPHPLSLRELSRAPHPSFMLEPSDASPAPPPGAPQLPALVEPEPPKQPAALHCGGSPGSGADASSCSQLLKVKSKNARDLRQNMGFRRKFVLEPVVAQSPLITSSHRVLRMRRL